MWYSLISLPTDDAPALDPGGEVNDVADPDPEHVDLPPCSP